MPHLTTPPGFDSESGFVLWEATVADKYPPFDDDGKRDYWRYLRLRRRDQLTDAELYRVAQHDSDPDIRKLAAEEIAHRETVITRALFGDPPPERS